MAHRSPGVPGTSLTVRRFVWALAALLLLVTPALDLAWNEPAADESQGARCQLHATPAVPFEVVYLAVALRIELLPPLDLPDRSPLVGRSIFIPPRL